MSRRADLARRARGYTLLEAMVVLAILGTLATLGVGALNRIREQSASESLLLVVEGLLGEARTRAIQDSVHVGVRFGQSGGAVVARLYRDGDGDGVTAEDVRRGVDRPLGPAEVLRADGARVAVPEGASCDPSGAPLSPGDPVRFGRGDCLSFSPLATATPGTLYLSEGDGSSGWAIRVAGLDGRVRLWRFRHGGWYPVQAL